MINLAAKVRISEQRTKGESIFLCFFERKCLLAKRKVQRKMCCVMCHTGVRRICDTDERGLTRKSAIKVLRKCVFNNQSENLLLLVPQTPYRNHQHTVIRTPVGVSPIPVNTIRKDGFFILDVSIFSDSVFRLSAPSLIRSAPPILISISPYEPFRRCTTASHSKLFLSR